MKKETSILLKKAGIPNQIKGYEYLGEAVEMVVRDKNVIHAITKELYPSVSKKFGTTPSRVERGIRHAVTKSFDNMDQDTVYELFGNTISYHRGKATNAQFIAALSDVIRVADNEG